MILNCYVRKSCFSNTLKRSRDLNGVNGDFALEWSTRVRRGNLNQCAITWWRKQRPFERVCRVRHSVE